MENIYLSLITGIFIAAAGSLLGTFAILKRMALVGDALSHVALPGIALALLWKINPFVGALAFLVLAVVGIWLLEYKSTLSVETIVGVFFAASLAFGALFIPQIELVEALFGDISKINLTGALLTIMLSTLLIIVIWKIHRKLALHMVSQELAHSVGIKTKQIELLYLLLFALAVALGIQFVGALLMGALIIIPAAASKNIARGLHGFMLLSVVFGIISAVAGISAASIYSWPPGPIFILVGTIIFIVSLLWRSQSKKQC